MLEQNEVAVELEARDVRAESRAISASRRLRRDARATNSNDSSSAAYTNVGLDSNAFRRIC
jgi:hypothetical protein